MIEALAWSLLAVIAVAFIGYPAGILVLSVMRPARPYHLTGAMNGNAPSASVLICAHNEEEHLAEKLDSVLRSARAYPGAVEVLVADDGSSDRTPAIIAAYSQQDVRSFILPRGGKAAALNTIASAATGDILVLTDADTVFDTTTLTAVIAPFNDRGVGAVAGNVLPKPKESQRDSGGHADSIFRRYESAIRMAEDRLFGTISADGGLLGIRRELMPHVPPDGTDDFHVSTAAAMAGLRIAFAPFAQVTELPLASGRKSLRRRVRITVRGLTALFRRRALMNPLRHGGYAIGLFFHKLLRRFAPLLLIPFALCVIALAANGNPFWIIIALIMVGCIILVAAGWLIENRLPKFLKAPYLIALHLIGLGMGVILFLSGRRYAQWTPTSG